MEVFGVLWKVMEFHVDKGCEEKYKDLCYKGISLLKWNTYTFMDTLPLPLGYYSL
jgi:hypothetical protein